MPLLNSAMEVVGNCKVVFPCCLKPKTYQELTYVETKMLLLIIAVNYFTKKCEFWCFETFHAIVVSSGKKNI